MVEHLDASKLLFGIQCSDAFVPFMHLVSKYKRHAFLKEGFKPILTIHATLFTNELMKLIKLCGMFPTRKQGSKELTASKPHLSAHRSYLRTKRTVNMLCGKRLDTKVTNLLFN